MFQNKISILIYTLIGLAILGFASQLITNTASLLTSLLVMVAIGAVIYGAVYYFFIRKRTSDELKKYKKAVKQSKSKYKTTDDKKAYTKASKKTSKKQNPFGTKRRNLKSRANHLRVIEGNKEKGKNRASF